jgi:hypothetical protein
VAVTQGTSPWVVSGTVSTTLTGADTPADGRANPTTDLATTSFGEVFNGATWDRMRSGTATGSTLVNNPTPGNLQATVTQGSPWTVSLASTTITGTVAVTQSTSPWVVSLASTTITGTVAVVGSDTAADAHANPTTALISDSYNSVFNGTTWDRMRSGTATGSVLVNNPTAANFQATVTGVVALGGTTSPTTSLSAQSAVQNGAVLDDGSMRTHHTIVVTTSAGVSAGAVQLQVSQDNANWFPGVTISVTNANTVYSADVTGAFRYSRASISTVITGGTISATIASV